MSTRITLEDAKKATSPKITIGRIVHYRLTIYDAKEINRRRVIGVGHSDKWPAGAQAHIGNPALEGDVYPMIVVHVAPNRVNGQVFLDGSDVLWVTAVIEGDRPGTWS